MTKLTPEHIVPLARAFDEACRAGTIPLKLAMDFAETVEDSVLEYRVRVNDPKLRYHKPTPEGNGPPGDGALFSKTTE